MIRIKNYIFNEHEIVKIQFEEGTKEIEIDHKSGNRTFIDGTLEDIEFDYEYKQDNEYVNRLNNQIKELVEVFTSRGFTNIEQMATMFDYYKSRIDKINGE